MWSRRVRCFWRSRRLNRGNKKGGPKSALCNLETRLEARGWLRAAAATATGIPARRVIAHRFTARRIVAVIAALATTFRRTIIVAFAAATSGRTIVIASRCAVAFAWTIVIARPAIIAASTAITTTVAIYIARSTVTI